VSQCTAKAKSTGKPCTRRAIAGGAVCQVHGGAAPQVREAARIRLLEMVDPALGVLARAVRKRKDPKWEPNAVELAACREILNRVDLRADGPAGSLDQPGGTWEEFQITYRRHVEGV
jgi:hypothetical protein